MKLFKMFFHFFPKSEYYNKYLIEPFGPSVLSAYFYFVTQHVFKIAVILPFTLLRNMTWKGIFAIHNHC